MACYRPKKLKTAGYPKVIFMVEKKIAMIAQEAGLHFNLRWSMPTLKKLR